MSPIIFWGMFAIVLLALGTMFRDVFNSWYLPWGAVRASRVQATPPSELRNIIRRQKQVISGLTHQVEGNNAQIGALLSENANLRNEIKTLVQRNVMLSNEARCDHTAKTQALPYKFHPYRQFDEMEVEPDE